MKIMNEDGKFSGGNGSGRNGNRVKHSPAHALDVRVFQNLRHVVGRFHGRMLLLWWLLLWQLMWQLGMEGGRQGVSTASLWRRHHEPGHGPQRGRGAVDMRLIIRFGLGVAVGLGWTSEGVAGRRVRGFEGVGNGVIAVVAGGLGVLVEGVASKGSQQRALGGWR